MQDQVDALVRYGFRAAVLNSTIDEAERRYRLAQLRQGKLELLYVAPEALGTWQKAEAAKWWPDVATGLRDITTLVRPR